MFCFRLLIIFLFLNVIHSYRHENSSFELRNFRHRMDNVLKRKLDKYWEMRRKKIYYEYFSSLKESGREKRSVGESELGNNQTDSATTENITTFGTTTQEYNTTQATSQMYKETGTFQKQIMEPHNTKETIAYSENVTAPEKSSADQIHIVSEVVPLTPSSFPFRNNYTRPYFTVPSKGFNISFFHRQPRESLGSNITIPTSRGDLKFLDVPPGGGMKVPGIKVAEGYFVFSFITKTMQFLQPKDFPSELLKDWVWNRLTSTQLMLEVIHVEAGFIGYVTILLILCLALPSAILVYTCCRLSSRRENERYAEMSDRELRCRRIALIAILDFMLILLPVGIIGMFTSNEQLTQAIQQTPEVNDAVFSDLDVFVRNTQLQVRFVATTSVDRAVDAAVASLEEVEDLLGKPIQRELAMETGLDVALDALSDICTASKDVATEVLALRAEAQAAREAARLSQDRLKELKRQVETTKKQCIERDRNLCDTIDTSGLEVIFKIDKILAERKLSKLRHLGEDNLTQAVAEARLEYQDIPQKIVRDTETTRTEIKKILTTQRQHLYDTVKSLEDISKYFTTSISVASANNQKIIGKVVEVEQWRWLTTLGASVTVLVVWTLLTCAVVCANCGCETKVAPILYTSIALVSIFSLGLWFVASGALFIGGNSDVFVCKPLQDDPNYATLTMILDSPGLLYKRGGLFSNILNGNDTMNVPIKQVLRECRLNQPAFPTFSLNRIFNIDSVTNHLTWPKLHAFLNNLTVDIKDIEILKPALQKNLQDLSQAARVNLTTYRSQISGQTTGTDLSSFSDQLERIANQMTDLTTSARMETLASRTRKLLSNNVQKLEKHKEEIIYKLTTLEVHLLPLQRQANQSLSHLKTIQYYISNQGSSISERKKNQYVEKLVSYLERFREHVLNELTYEVAPCKPVWDVFQITRSLLCENIVEPINGFWVSVTWCLLIFMALTPIALVLAMDYCYFANSSLHRDLEELLLEEQAHWASTPQSTPEGISTPEQSWATPRRTSQQLLVPQRDTVRMIEQIMPWHVPSTTRGFFSQPRGWL